MSNLRPEGRQDRHDNVFDGLTVGTDEASLVVAYLAVHDFSEHTRRAIRNDLRKFARWFSQANREPFIVKRVTLRDVTDFRDHLSREKRQAVASVNRALTPRLFWLFWGAKKGDFFWVHAKKVGPAPMADAINSAAPSSLNANTSADFFGLSPKKLPDLH
jgi:hypothetical protein